MPFFDARAWNGSEPSKNKTELSFPLMHVALFLPFSSCYRTFRYFSARLPTTPTMVLSSFSFFLCGIRPLSVADDKKCVWGRGERREKHKQKTQINRPNQQQKQTNTPKTNKQKNPICFIQTMSSYDGKTGNWWQHRTVLIPNRFRWKRATVYLQVYSHVPNKQWLLCPLTSFVMQSHGPLLN